MNPFKILIFAVVANSAFAGDASKDVNLTANASRNQKEVKMLEAFCESILPFSMASCMQLVDKRLDENSAFYDRQKGLAALQKVCDSKDERGGTDCLYAKFFDKARDGMTDEYVRKMKKYLKKVCDADEKEGYKEFEKLRKL